MNISEIQSKILSDINKSATPYDKLVEFSSWNMWLMRRWRNLSSKDRYNMFKFMESLHNNILKDK